MSKTMLTIEKSGYVAKIDLKKDLKHRKLNTTIVLSFFLACAFLVYFQGINGTR